MVTLATSPQSLKKRFRATSLLFTGEISPKSEINFTFLENEVILEGFHCPKVRKKNREKWPDLYIWSLVCSSHEYRT
jgi:hypothetical protein